MTAVNTCCNDGSLFTIWLEWDALAKRDHDRLSLFSLHQTIGQIRWPFSRTDTPSVFIQLSFYLACYRGCYTTPHLVLVAGLSWLTDYLSGHSNPLSTHTVNFHITFNLLSSRHRLYTAYAKIFTEKMFLFHALITKNIFNPNSNTEMNCVYLLQQTCVC